MIYPEAMAEGCYCFLEEQENGIRFGRYQENSR